MGNSIDSRVGSAWTSTVSAALSADSHCGVLPSFYSSLRLESRTVILSPDFTW